MITTKFFVRDEAFAEQKFRPVTREKYKELIRSVDKANIPYRVTTQYIDGTPAKRLTILKGGTSNAA